MRPCQNRGVKGKSLVRARRTAGTGLPSSVTVTPSDQTFTIAATSKSGNVFTITKQADGTVKRTCTRTEPKGGCNAVADADGNTW
jgi:hypothetical protein